MIYRSREVHFLFWYHTRFLFVFAQKAIYFSSKKQLLQYDSMYDRRRGDDCRCVRGDDNMETFSHEKDNTFDSSACEFSYHSRHPGEQGKASFSLVRHPSTVPPTVTIVHSRTRRICNMLFVLKWVPQYNGYCQPPVVTVKVYG